MENIKKEEFHVTLFKTFKDHQNLIISPLSIYVALSMTAVGAGGKTLSQFLNLLDSESLDALIEKNNRIQKTLKDAPQVSLANKIYHNVEIKNEYQQLITSHFCDNIQKVDFSQNRDSIVNEINQWISANTNNMIQNILQPNYVDPNTKLMLINGIYFKGTWVNKFDPSYTIQSKFYMNHKKIGDGVKADLMYQKGSFYYYQDEDETFQYISLPYENSSLSMEIFLPSIDLRAFKSDLTSKQISKARNNSQKKDVHLYLPKFEVKNQLLKDIKENLYNLGLRDCFDNNDCDMKAISESNKLCIKNIFHKAVIEVNEQGTEAAAVTVVIEDEEDEDDQVFEEEIHFRCDTPFAYMITTHNNICVFMGALVNPKE